MKDIHHSRLAAVARAAIADLLFADVELECHATINASPDRLNAAHKTNLIENVFDGIEPVLMWNASRFSTSH